MDRLTLDTNILRDWAWCEGKSTEKRYGNNEPKKEEIKVRITELKKLRDDRVCELGITTQLYTDFSESRGKLPKEMIVQGFEFVGEVDEAGNLLYS
jgi:hypothetical protein